MPISTSDPRYRAETSPQSLINLGNRLKRAYGVGADNFGIKGNEYHDSGFHRSRSWILFSPDSQYGTSDYSVKGTRNHGGSPDNVCAFDFTPGEWGSADNRAKMIELTKRLRAAARANDPRLANWYEFAGTEDGKNVVTFYAQGGGAKSPFDRTHLDHIHGSGYRDNIENDHTGLGDILLGVDKTKEDDDMGAYLGPFLLPVDKTSHTITPVQGGAANPRRVWLNVGADLYGEKACLRVWVSNGDGVFRVLKGSKDDSGFVILDSGKLFSVELEKGVRVISFARWSLTFAGDPVEPSGNGVGPQPYAGSISVGYECGPVMS
jgi:hypothetical protein